MTNVDIDLKQLNKLLNEAFKNASDECCDYQGVVETEILYGMELLQRHIMLLAEGKKNE